MVKLSSPFPESVMKSISAAILVALGLFAALWWGTALPRYAPVQATTIEQQRQAQCPSNSQLQGGLCVCPDGTGWDGAHCVAIKVSVNECLDDPLPYRLVNAGGAQPDVHVPQPGNMVWLDAAQGGARALGIVEAVTENALTVITTHPLTGAMVRRSGARATASCHSKAAVRENAYAAGP